MAIRVYEGVKILDGKKTNVKDALVVEEALAIHINNEPYTITMCTPGDDEELVRGLLYSEDVIEHNTTLSFELIDRCNDEIIKTLNVTIPIQKLNKGYKNSRNLLSVSSCGICGKTSLKEMKGSLLTDFTMSSSLFFNMFNHMEKNQNTFEKSGGSHAAAAFDENGDLLSIKEDVGRHNAVDKVIGELLLKGLLNKTKCLTVSGRISYEIVVKVFRAKIPILSAVSSPSSLAVDFAKELGITLLGFSRGNKTTCYSHPTRIAIDS